MGKNVIAVIGQGFVGGSLTTVMSERGFEVLVHDKTGKVSEGGFDPLSIVDCQYPIARMLELADVTAKREPTEGTNIQKFVSACEDVEGFSGIYFVCLPTPMFEDGGADLSIVDGVLNELSSMPGERIAVVKSTVPPGSVETWNKKYSSTGLHVVFNPEFLREASALDDMRNQDRIIIGGPKEFVNNVRDIYSIAFPNVAVHKTSATNAEFVKYVANCLLAIKLSFANELFQIVSKFNQDEADYDRIVELAMLDKRLGDSHWKVPGPMPADDGSNKLLPGWAGSCFVKDINAFMSLAKKMNVDPKVMRAAWEKNLEVRPQKDWEYLVGRAVSKKQ